MDMLHIPETATETYLERLAENITHQLEKAKNKKVRTHLTTMLKEVQQRLAEIRRQTERFPEEAEAADNLDVLELTEVVEEEQETQDVAEEAEEESDVLLLTEMVEEEEAELPVDVADLSEKEQGVVKDRLKQILGRLQDKRQVSPNKSESVLLNDVMHELDEVLLDTTDLTTEQQTKVKGRLKGILQVIHAKGQQGEQGASIQGFLETLTKGRHGGEELTEEAQQGDGSGTTVSKTRFDHVEFRPVSGDDQFIEVCRKVSRGESPELLKALSLSEREQDLVNAFLSNISSYKGMKKQQAFEMQHLTARSIHELDLIFKTYHIQGYLKAELNNVYNRLLNIRGRFSILLN